MKRLTKEQAEARVQMYEEAIDHMGASVHENQEEILQAQIVAREIRAMQERFIERHFDTIYPKDPIKNEQPQNNT